MTSAKKQVVTADQSGTPEEITTHEADQLLVDQDSDIAPMISIVMPTLNEEEGVGECITRAKNAIAELGMTAEIILSDSSTDQTPDIGRKMGATILEPDGSGYGYAYRYAFDRTRGEYIVMGDADTTYDFEQIPRLLDHLRNEDADIVMGSRLDGEIKPGAMPPLHQYIGNPLLTKLLNSFYGAGVSDAHSGFRVFTAEAYDRMELTTTGMEFASEMIMEAGAKDLEIVEVPIIYHEREGEETLESFKDGWRHVRFMFENAPGYLFSIPGVVLSVIGSIVMILAYVGLSVGGVTLGVHSMILGSFLVIVGLQTMSFGVFAAIGGNPIREPRDPVTQWLRDSVTLERGAIGGATIFGIGSLYVGFMTAQWIQSGFASITFSIGSVAAFAATAVGLQILFSSLFFGFVSHSNGSDHRMAHQ